MPPGAIAGSGRKLLQAVGLLILSGAVFTGSTVVIKHCTADLHPFVIVFFRNLLSALITMPFVFLVNGNGLQTRRTGLYFLRSIISLISMLGWFYGVSFVPLGTATAINFTMPLFAMLSAVLLIGEKLSPRRLLLLLVGFVGTLIILKPETSLSQYSWIILLSAAATGLNVVTVKMLSRSESALSIVTYLALMMTPLSLVPALLVWSWPTFEDLGWLALIALLGTLATFLGTKAYAMAKANVLAPFEFCRLLFATLFGFWFFAETVTLEIWYGAAIIAAAASLTLQDERSSRKRFERQKRPNPKSDQTILLRD